MAAIAHSRRPPPRTSRGFTLVELLVVVLIIGILAAIALPRFLGQRTRAKNAAAQAAVRHALVAARSYYAQNSESYAGLGPAELKGYESSLSGTEPPDNQAPGSSANPQDIWIGNGSGGSNPTSGDASGGKTVTLCSVSKGDTTYCVRDADGVASYLQNGGGHGVAVVAGGAYGASGWNGGVTGVASSSVSSGWRHSCAVVNGAAECWGDNTYGQVGNGSTTANVLTPTVVSGLSSGVSQVLAGYYHTCALMTNGTVRCWGRNGQGQLGDGSATGHSTCSGEDCSLTPVTASGISGVTQLSVGGHHSCALIAGGIKCWGRSHEGQMGDGIAHSTCTVNIGCSPSPVIPTGLSSGVSQVLAGVFHTCAVLSSNGEVRCWGYNNWGQVGDGTTNTSTTPQSIIASGASAVSGPYTLTCALMTVGSVKCWGQNNFGQIGDGSISASVLSPTTVQGLSSSASMVAVGYYHACAKLVSSAMCWGYNAWGQLGTGSASGHTNCSGEDCSPTPLVASLVGSSLTNFGTQTGWRHACYLLAGGATRCVGANYAAQMGDGTTSWVSANLVTPSGLY